MPRKTTRSLSPPPRGRSHGGKSTVAALPSNQDRLGRSLSPTPKTSKTPKSMSVEEAVATLPLDAVQQQDDTQEFEDKVKRCIPSEFVLIASQDSTSQAQEDFFAMNHFALPLREGRARWLNSELAGSVATCALLQLLYEHPNSWVGDSSSSSTTDTTNKPPVFTTLDMVQEIQTRIKRCSRQDANPTLSSSRPLGPPRFDDGVYAPYYIVPPNYRTGTRRALLMGCVTGEHAPLKGPLNDVANMRYFLTKHCGFREDDIVVLRDDCAQPLDRQPTKATMLQAFDAILRRSRPGDVNFLQFSGHGSRSATNLYLLPSDYKTSGYIMDDYLLNNLIKAMPSKVYTTFLVDCCYSGTVGELPYILKTDSTEQEIELKFEDATNNDASSKKDKQKTKIPDSKGAKPKTKKTNAKQKIELFYDMDTREEVIEKEQQGGQDYQMWKKARKVKRTWMHFEPNKLLQAAKKAGAKATVSAKDAAKKISTATKEAATSASTSLQSAASPLRRVVASDGTVTHVPMRDRSKSPVRHLFGRGHHNDDNDNHKDENHDNDSSELSARARTSATSTTSSHVNDNHHAVDLEEAARKEAIERSKREAAEQRAAARGRSPARQDPPPAKSSGEGENDNDGDQQLRDFEEAARREAIERSRREAAKQRAAAKARRAHAAPADNKDGDDDDDQQLRDFEEAARREAIERSRREAEEQRAAARANKTASKSPLPDVTPRTKTLEELAREQEEEARRAAIANSKQEAARERSQSPMRSRNG